MSRRDTSCPAPNEPTNATSHYRKPFARSVGRNAIDIARCVNLHAPTLTRLNTDKVHPAPRSVRPDAAAPHRAAALDDVVAVGDAGRAPRRSCRSPGSTGRAALQARQAAPDLGADQRRQAFGRLVEDQQPRIGHQRAADRQHLLLAAGEQARPCCRARSASRGNSAQTLSSVHGSAAPRAVGRGRRPDSRAPSGWETPGAPPARGRCPSLRDPDRTAASRIVAAVEADRARASPASAP